jgi:hypothetical protein
MRQIERNGPLFVDDIQVTSDGTKSGDILLLNRRTHALMSNAFAPTIENIESIMKQCFEAGQRAKAAELCAVLGIAR